MIKVLFCIAKYAGSIGEVTNARLLCEQLPQDKYKYYFLADDESNDYVKNHLGLETLSFDEIIGQKFDIIIISDYYPFIRFIIENSYNEKEKEVYQYLLSLNIPVLVIDVLGLYNNWRKKDPKYACILSKLCLKPYTSQCNPIKCQPVNFRILYPCPPHHPFPAKNTYCNYLPLYPLSIDEQEKKTIKSKIGIDRDDSKVIFMTLSNWEYKLFKEQTKSIYFFVLEKLLIHYLLKLNKKIDLIIVSPLSFYFSYNIENINVKHISITPQNLIPLKEYEKLFLCADLIISSNIIQSTFIRAVYSGIPGITLTSNIPIQDRDKELYRLMPPFMLNSFTTELLDIMETTCPFSSSDINQVYSKEFFLFRRSPVYQQLFSICELFDQRKMTDLIYKYLYDENTKQNFTKLRENYVKLINELPDSKQIIEAI